MSLTITWDALPRRVRQATSLLLVLPVFAPAVGAQDTVASPPPAPTGGLPEWAKTIGRIGYATFGGRVHAIVGGVASGGGIGAGIGYDAGLREPWDFDVDVRRTLRDYWSARAIAGYERGSTEIEAYARIREMPRLSFYGLGNESEESDRTDFRLRDQVVGIAGDSRLVRWLHAGARIEYLRPEFGDGADAGHPNVGEVFPALDAGARIADPTYWRYQGFAELRAAPGPGESFHQGTVLRARYTLHDDQDDRFSFDVSELNFRHRIAGFGDYHRLTLHAWAGSARPRTGQSIPFYMLPTLGGKGVMRSVHEDPLGSDGTTATLRGFRSSRFRDRDFLLLQAEYRFPIWGPVEMTVFTDAGKVAHTRSELDLDGLHADGGFSLSLTRVGGLWVRTDVAFSKEGTRYLFSMFKDYDL